MKHTRILLVEDSETDADLVRSHLQTAFGSRAILERASSLDGAIDLLLRAADPFDVILLDLTLPDSSGVETLAKLLPYAAATPVVVVTGDEDAQHVVRLAGASEFVAKGDFSAVVAVIISTVQRSRQGREEAAAMAGRWQTVAAGIAELRQNGAVTAERLANLQAAMSAARDAVATLSDSIDGRHGLESRVEVLEVAQERAARVGQWAVRILVGTALAGLVVRWLGGGPVDVP